MERTQRSTRRRILVVANETSEGPVLHELIRVRAGDASDVLVVAPALNSRLRHWASDGDHARGEAEARLRRCLAGLGRSGIAAEGVVGDEDPLQAIADVLCGFDADELVIATRPEERSHWLARRVVERARKRFGLPVLHVVVDRAAGAEYLHDATLPAAA
jgi:hypothetical protein